MGTAEIEGLRRNILQGSYEWTIISSMERSNAAGHFVLKDDRVKRTVSRGPLDSFRVFSTTAPIYTPGWREAL